MRIGINTIFLVAGEGGGIERYLRNLLKAFQKIDHNNEYTIFTNRDNTGTFDITHNFKEYFVPTSARFRPMKILWEQFVLPFQVKKAGIDVLFSPGNISPFFLHCPSVVVINDLIPFAWPEHFTRAELYPLKVLLRLTAKKATRIITISKSSERQIIDRLNIRPDKITMVGAACDEHFLDSKPTSNDKKRTKAELGIREDFILYTASTRTYKNVDRLLLAFSLLKKKYAVKHQLVITGLAGPHHRNLVEKAGALELGEQVVFTGFVPDNALPALYAAASVFVYPSLYEGFGLPVLEAMACGTAVVASNATSLPEVVGGAGVLVDPHNVEQLSDGIYRVLTDHTFHNELISRGHKRVREFSWEKTAGRVLDVLQACA